MGNIEKYYDNTEVDIPHDNVKEFIELVHDTGNAVELGCGAGRDSVFLLRNNWNVLAIDREDVEDRIKKRLTSSEAERFRFQKQDFESVVLEENNLVVANYSLPFCNKNEFFNLWEKVTSSILPNRFFCWQFFWS